MFLDTGIKAPNNLRLCVPFREKPMKIKHIIKKFPEFAKMFDGTSKECCLTYYYKKTKVKDEYGNEEILYEFIDEEAEDEVAELMGVNVEITELLDEDSHRSQDALNSKQLQEFQEHIAEIKANINI